MPNPQLLEKRWKESGKKKIYLAKKINVSRPRLDYIFEHPETATVGQADLLSKELSISAMEKNLFFYHGSKQNDYKGGLIAKSNSNQRSKASRQNYPLSATAYKGCRRAWNKQTGCKISNFKSLS